MCGTEARGLHHVGECKSAEEVEIPDHPHEGLHEGVGGQVADRDEGEEVAGEREDV